MSVDSSAARWHVASRVAAAVLGGYAFTWGFIALGMAALFGLGMPFHDAEALGTILGMLVFLTGFLWAFAARSVARVWVVLAGGGALMTTAASLVQHALV